MTDLSTNLQARLTLQVRLPCGCVAERSHSLVAGSTVPDKPAAQLGEVLDYWLSASSAKHECAKDTP